MSLPFGLGSAEREADLTERRAAWPLYVELVTRVFRECSFVGVAATGASVVILSGGVDLSSGAVMKLACVTLGALYVNAGWPGAAALAAGLEFAQ